jgi:hypothetical protein
MLSVPPEPGEGPRMGPGSTDELAAALIRRYDFDRLVTKAKLKTQRQAGLFGVFVVIGLKGPALRNLFTWQPLNWTITANPTSAAQTTHSVRGPETACLQGPPG